MKEKFKSKIGYTHSGTFYEIKVIIYLMREHYVVEYEVGYPIKSAEIAKWDFVKKKLKVKRILRSVIIP